MTIQSAADLRKELQGATSEDILVKIRETCDALYWTQRGKTRAFQARQQTQTARDKREHEAEQAFYDEQQDKVYQCFNLLTQRLWDTVKAEASQACKAVENLPTYATTATEI